MSTCPGIINLMRFLPSAELYIEVSRDTSLGQFELELGHATVNTSSKLDY
jgi:hypothetical protein